MENFTWVIMNEQHTLLPEQLDLIEGLCGEGWDFLDVPASGWDLNKIREIAKTHFSDGQIAVFVSPVPALLSLLSFSAGCWSLDLKINHCPHELFCRKVWVFHNDHRVAKELPNGKVIHVVAETGWVLV